MDEGSTLPDLDRLSATLLERLSKDESGPPATAASHLVGRLVKSASGLENLLRGVVVYVAAQAGRNPEDILAPLAGGKRPNLRRSMAGPLAYGLRDHFSRRGSAVPAVVAPLIHDLLAPNSVILRFIAVRNDVAKEDGDPKKARAVTSDLKKLIAEFRRSGGWK